MELRSIGWALALTLATPAAAGAIDLTGTWQRAKPSRCKGLQQNGDKLSVQTFFVSMHISQVAEDISAEQGVFSYDGAVYGDSRKDRGQGTLVKCSGTFPEVRAAFQILSAKTFPPNSSGLTGRMTTLFHRADTAAGSVGAQYCKVVWERTDPANPAVAGCP
jgi:hypothetical protein